MKRIISICLVSILLIVVGIGCVPTAAQPAAQPTVNINTVNAEVAAVKTWSTGIDAWRNTTVDPMIAKINRGEIGGGSTNYQSQLDSIKATMTGTDAKITALETRVTALENKITALSATTPVGTTGTTIGTTGNIPQFTPGISPGNIATSATGQVIQQVNFSTMGNLLYAGSGGSNQLYYTQRFINYNTAQMFIVPKISLGLSNNYGYANTPQTVTNVTFNITGGTLGYYGYSPVAASYSSTNTTQNFQINGSTGIAYYLINPPLGTSAYSLTIAPQYSYYKGIPIGAGQFFDINVQIYGLYCTPGATWTVTPQFDQSL